MSYIFKPATREATPLLIGEVGPSGCGKTFSALRLATGIQKVRGGKIIGIDTEARRMLHYADDFNFTHCQFGEPFGSLNYTEVIKAAAKEAQEGVIIIDSMSHEHEGMGGYLDFHDKECNRLAGSEKKASDQVSWRAWAKPAANRRILINTILQIPCAFIFCFRAKEKSIIVRNTEKNRWDIASIGWQAISGDEFVFEMVIRFLLPPGREGIPSWTGEDRENGVPKIHKALKHIITYNRQLDEDLGKELAEWAAGKTNGKTNLPERPRESVEKTAGKGNNAQAEDRHNTTDSPAPAQDAKNALADWWQTARDNRQEKRFLGVIKSVTKKMYSELTTPEEFEKALKAIVAIKEQLK